MSKDDYASYGEYEDEPEEPKKEERIMTEERQERLAEMESEDAEEDQNLLEMPSRDMTDVFDKVIQPSAVSQDADISRDIKLTKTNFQEREYIMRLKAMIWLCKRAELGRATKFYKSLMNYYVNLLSSDKATTLNALISQKHFISKDAIARAERSGSGFFDRFKR